VKAPEELQARLEHVQGHGRLPSVVAGVLDRGSLGWVGAAGEVGHGPDEWRDTQYRIGSITKTLVAVLVLRARDEGLVSLDDPIGRFVPETGYAEATLRSLLAHGSGMQSEPAGPWWERSPGVTVPALLAANPGSGRVAGAGEYYHYSNLGYALLGEAVARLRGAGWWDCVSEELLGPLGMTRTTYLPEPPHAQGHSVDHFTGVLADEPHQDTGAMAPAGQAWSTVTDLRRWADFLATGHPDVLAHTSLDEMATVQPPAPGYGLGLRLLELDGRRLRGHTGSMPGFLASLFVDPATRDGVVLLTNATTGVGTESVPQLLLGEAAPPTVEPWVPSATLPSELAGLPGLWFWGNTAYELRWHNERVRLHEIGEPAGGHHFELRGGRVVGTEGYHRGENLHVVRRDDGSVHYLECATFVYTRVPYDPDVDIPGGHP
jgi:CubicO group peptidase (beta-lactamase class C family)